MKTSLTCTVLNEEKAIGSFLESIFQQSKLPDEIVIVDAGSTDQTIKGISEFNFTHIKNAPNIKLISKKGNRSVGRNEAIKHANGSIILVSDAGCVLEKDWVKNISAPFSDENIGVVSGFYIPVSKNIFEKCLGVYTSTMPDKIDKNNFLPSSRSVAFRKTAWTSVNGYPENLDTCEDLVFDKKLKEAGFKFFFAQKALVYWPQRHNFMQAFKQFFAYAMGDGLAGYFRPQTPFLFLRYAVAICLVILALIIKSSYLSEFIFMCLLLYIAWAIQKNYRYVRNYKAIFYLSALQFVSDLAVLSGTSLGILKKIRLEN